MTVKTKHSGAIPVPGVSPEAKAIECPAFLLNTAGQYIRQESGRGYFIQSDYTGGFDAGDCCMVAPGPAARLLDTLSEVLRAAGC